VFIDEYWDKLWILLVSHGFLAFVGLSRSDLQSFLHTDPSSIFISPTSRSTMLVQKGDHPWHLWDHISMGKREVGF